MIEDFKICGESVAPGTRKRVYLQTSKLYDATEMRIPIEVIHGKKEGPALFVCAAIHGDEINGVEVIRRLNLHPSLKKLAGTLLLVPIVNVFGYNSQTRYMPDRRDLNRAFPGSKKGSLTSQLAAAFMQEVVCRCSYGIDLHTAGLHRTNISQIRANLNDKEIYKLASGFGVPVVLDAEYRDGSIRQAAFEKGVPVLLFEGGTALRYNQKVIKTALKGTLQTMEMLGMISQKKKKNEFESYIAKSSRWVRAPASGSLWRNCELGVKVNKGDVIGAITDPLGEESTPVIASHSGIVIGFRIFPLIHKGDALFHVATFEESDEIEEAIENWEDMQESFVDDFELYF